MLSISRSKDGHPFAAVGSPGFRAQVSDCNPLEGMDGKCKTVSENQLEIGQNWVPGALRKTRRALSNFAIRPQIKAPGQNVLQAEIAACHARAQTAAETDWNRILALYDMLIEVAPSPVVKLNRAVALAMATGPAAGLELIDALASEPSLRNYHLLPAVRGDLLRKLGRLEEARGIRAGGIADA
jgi:hypothetical protein